MPPLPSRPIVGFALVCSVSAQVQFMELTGRSFESLLPTASARSGIAFGDVDANGTVDAVAGEANVLAIHRRTASGATQTQTVPTSNGRMQPRLVDLDQDAAPDVLVGPADPAHPRRFFVLRNGGLGTFVGVALPTALTATDMQGAVAGDLDGDGDGDLVVAPVPGSGAAPLQVFQNTGNLTFQQAPAAIPNGVPAGCWPVLFDQDGDGDLDLFASNVAAADVLLRNQGNGTFIDARSSLPPGRLGHQWAVAADLDGDGRQDVATIWFNGDLDIHWGAPGGALTFQPGLANVAGAARATPADVDGDADLDLLVFTANAVVLLQNGGGRQFARSTVVSGVPFEGEGVADVSGDGRADVTLATNAGPRNRTWFGGPTGFAEDVATTQGFQALPEMLSLRQAPIAGDVDGDGHPDVLFFTEQGTVVQHGRGANRWVATLSPQAVASTSFLQRPALLDLDGDGDLDLALIGYGPLALFANNGSGTFTPTQTIQGTAGRAAFADLDGDGDTDIVRLAASGLELHPNNGNGVFAAGTLLFASTVGYALAVADVDGDGDTDILTDFATAGGDVLLRNLGGGTFAAVPAGPFGGFALAYAVGDVDRDGDLDVVSRCMNEQALRLFVNSGSGVFSEVPAAFPSMIGPNGGTTRLADLDGDGDLDVVSLFGLGVASVRIFVNAGNGTFADPVPARWQMPFPPPSSFEGELTIGDCDGDGDPDIGLGNPGFLAQPLAWNHGAQLASRVAPPRPGGALQIDTFTGPGYGNQGFLLAMLALAQLPAPQHLSGIDGAFELGGPFVASIEFVPFDATGIRRSTVAIPPSTIWIGTPLWAQSLLLPAVGQPRFTNAVFEVVLP